MKVDKILPEIKLLPFEKSDFEKLISWVDNEEALVQFAGSFFKFPLTVTQLEKYLEDKNKLAFRVVIFPVASSIGHAEIELDGRTAVLCRIIIGVPAYRGCGIGLQLVKKLLQISFIDLDVIRVELNVFDWNAAAIKCYKNAGISVNTNKSKTRVINGKVHTVLNMTIDKTDWENT